MITTRNNLLLNTYIETKPITMKPLAIFGSDNEKKQETRVDERKREIMRKFADVYTHTVYAIF